jgi:hypothetical protein
MKKLVIIAFFALSSVFAQPSKNYEAVLTSSNTKLAALRSLFDDETKTLTCGTPESYRIDPEIPGLIQELVIVASLGFKYAGTISFDELGLSIPTFQWRGSRTLAFVGWVEQENDQTAFYVVRCFYTPRHK